MTEPTPGLVLEGVRYLTTAEAAALLGGDVTEDMIRDWRKRGILKSAGRYRGGSNVYRHVDVAEAERRTRTERRGRTRRVGELRMIGSSGTILPTTQQAESVVTGLGCNVPLTSGPVRKGLFCNRPPVEGAPFRICRDHLEQAHRFWRQEFEPIRREPTPPPPPPGYHWDGSKIEPPKGNPHVYYIRFSDRIKIGHSTDVWKRLGNLPWDEVLAVEPGLQNLETMRHHQFADHRLRGEWFEMHPDLLSHIAMLVEHYGKPWALLNAMRSGGQNSALREAG